MKFLASFIMRGRMEAMLTASTLAILSLLMTPLSIFSSAVVALVTLRKGAYEGLIILGSSALAAAVMATFIQVPYLIVLIIALVLWLPIWLIAIVLREGRHLSLAIEMAVLIGIAVVIGYYLYNADPAAMWKQVMPRMIPANAQVENKEEIIEQMAPFMTGIAASGGVFSMLLSLLLGRWWQAILYNPGGFRQEFLGLKVQPKVPLISLAIVGIAMMSSGMLAQIAWNTTVLLSVMYTFIGIAVLHTLFSKMKIGHLAVPMFYITLVLIPHSLLPVALVGFSDTWMDLRKRTL
jgi:hypothetical protein